MREKEVRVKVRKISIATKIMILISTVTIICSVGLGLILYMRESETLINQAKSSAKDLARCAAVNIDGDAFVQIAEGDEESEEFQAVYDALSVYRDNSSVEYIYSMKMLGDELVFVVDTDEEEPADIFEPYEMLDEIAETLETGEVTTDPEVTTDEWGSFLSAYAPIYDSNNNIVGIVGADLTVEWVEQQLKGVRILVIICCIGFAAFGIVCAMLISMNLKKNLGKLHDKVREVASGDGDLTKKVEINSGDELELIATHMNTFINQIRELVSQVSVTAGAVSEGGSNIRATVDQNSEQTIRINDNISTVSAGMEECAASGESVYDELQITTVDMEKLRNNTLELRKVASGIHGEAQKFIEDAKLAKEKNNERLGNMNERLEQAAENAHKIELVQAMTNRIAEIASQTQILSLNARIESARAGEAGKGFAVVAGEINSLSEEITRTVEEINQTSSEVTTAVNELLKETYHLGDLYKESAEEDYSILVNVAEKYSGSARKINDHVGMLDQQTDDITKRVVDIRDSISEIERAVSESANSISEINYVTDQVMQQMQALGETAKINEQSVEDLSRNISRYRYEN